MIFLCLLCCLFLYGKIPQNYELVFKLLKLYREDDIQKIYDEIKDLEIKDVKNVIIKRLLKDLISKCISND